MWLKIHFVIVTTKNGLNYLSDEMCQGKKNVLEIWILKKRYDASCFVETNSAVIESCFNKDIP